MKIFFVLLVVCSAVAHAGITSNRGDDARPVDNLPMVLSRRLDDILHKLNRVAAPLYILSPEERASSREFLLILVDLERTEDERKSLARQLIQKDGISEEEKTSLITTMDLVFLLTRPFARKIPLLGKLGASTLVKLTYSEGFIFGSPETRKRMYLEECLNVIHKIKQDPMLFEEMMKVEKDQELMSMVLNGGFIF